MPRIRYVCRIDHVASAARNRGLDIAQGNWVSFLDSDDLWHPTKLERQRNALRTSGDEFGACFTDCGYVGHPDFKHTAFEESGLAISTDFGALEDPLKYHLGKPACFNLQSMMVRRDLLQLVNGFDEEMVVAEDTDLIFRLSFIARFCIVASPLVSIDRTSSRSGLMKTFSDRNERAALCRVHMFKEWLASPELVDTNTRRVILEALRHSYYSSSITFLYRYQFRTAVHYLMKLREMGESYASITSTLLSRAGRSILRSSRPDRFQIL